MNYNNKRFKAVSNSANGDVSENMIFHYRQEGNIVYCSYSDKDIVYGHLIGTVDARGVIDMSYHQINGMGEIRTGRCLSQPEVMPDGRIRIFEKWRWTSGDLSEGSSILEEVV